MQNRNESKDGVSVNFSNKRDKNNKIMGGVGIMELNDMQVQRRIN